MNTRLLQRSQRVLTLFKNSSVRLLHTYRWQRSAPFVKRRLQILVIREEALGDVLLTTPIVRQLRAQCPDSYITFLTNWKAEELLSNNPDIDEIVVNRSHLGKRRFDKTFELWYEYDPDMHIVDAYAKSAGVELTDKDYTLTLETAHRAYAERIFAENRIGQNDLVIGVHTQATWKNRRWSDDNFRKTLEYFTTRYQAKVIEFGSDPGAALGIGIDLTRKCSVKETAAVLERCTLLFCVDSLLLHLAGAVKTPTVCLFGPITPELRLPFNAFSIGCNLADLPCIGCHHRSPVPTFRTDCSQQRVFCMEDLEPEKVITTIEGLLARLPFALPVQ